MWDSLWHPPVCVGWDLVCDGHSVPDGWENEKERRQTLSLILCLLSPVLLKEKIERDACLLQTVAQSYKVQKLRAYADIK